MNRFYVLCCSIFISLGSFAQTTQIGAEVAYSADLFKVTDPNGRLSQPDVSSAFWGVNIRHLMSQHFFFETGLYTRAYKIGVAFDGGYGSQSSDRNGILLPLRLGARLPILRGAVAFCPVAGFTLGITDEGAGGLIGTAQDQGNEPITYSYKLQHPSQLFSLVQAGMGIDIKLWPKTILQLSSHYYGGLSKMMKQTIEYKPTNSSGNPVQAIQESRGSFYTIGIGIKRAVTWF